jgi:dihydroorotase
VGRTMDRLSRVGTHVTTPVTAPAAAAAASPSAVDLLIIGGRVIDPANNVDEIADVAISHGHIVDVGPDLQRRYSATTVHDARGMLVTPGLIDVHGHFYQHCTPLGEPADEVCIGRGVTTAVDAGSAGATTFEGFRHFAAGMARTRLLCILNACLHGLASAGSTGPGSGGELDSLNQVQVGPLVECIEANRDLVVGVKVRLSRDAADNGKNELEAYKRALEACERTGVPLMTHHTFSEVPLTQCPGADASPIKMRGGHLLSYPSVAPAVMQTP